ncbi:MAG: hypothetical protein WBF90_10330 [Rivularia sp. (in: cyanobacteria)]
MTVSPDSIHENVSATVSFKDGKVSVALFSTFGLDAGTKVPLARKDCVLSIDESSVSFLNGHGII